MRFCPQCLSMMTKSTTATGVIVFQCRCQLTVDGQPEDTLMFEEYIETGESNLKHDVMIENAPYDLAGNKVMKDCPNCGLNFMTMIRVGTSETTIYSCSCQYRATHAEYMQTMQKESANTHAKKNEKK